MVLDTEIFLFDSIEDFDFSTREIKPNEKDIGRKVKLKQNRTPLPPIRREPPSQRDSLPKPSYQSNVPSKTAAAVISSSNGLLSNGLGSNHVSSSRPQLNKPSVPDIARRPIKYVPTLITDFFFTICHSSVSMFFNQRAKYPSTMYTQGQPNLWLQFFKLYTFGKYNMINKKQKKKMRGGRKHLREIHLCMIFTQDHKIFMTETFF
jgi:hypothetical protein